MVHLFKLKNRDGSRKFHRHASDVRVRDCRGEVNRVSTINKISGMVNQCTLRFTDSVTPRSIERTSIEIYWGLRISKLDEVHAFFRGKVSLSYGETSYDGYCRVATTTITVYVAGCDVHRLRNQSAAETANVHTAPKLCARTLCLDAVHTRFLMAAAA